MDRTRKDLRFTICVILFALLMVFPLAAYSKDKIRIGQAVSLSGGNAIILQTAYSLGTHMVLKPFP